jgi:hypothetical protein
MVIQESAYEIAVKYLGEQVRGKIEVSENLPQGVIYGRDSLQNSWVVHVPRDRITSMRSGMSRIICISKTNGKIVYDGSDGGE